MSHETTIERPNSTTGVDCSRLGADDSTCIPPLTIEQFRELRWDYAEDGSILAENPAHVPLFQRFLAAKSDVENLRSFIEDLGGTWDATPYSPDET
jgi:hypothetical protein